MPEEEDKERPDYDPIMSEKELGYLERIQQENSIQATQDVYIQNNEKQGEIIDLRTKSKPTLEGEDETASKGRKLDFSMKNSNKNNEAKKFQMLKANENKPNLVSSSLRSHLKIF